MTQERMSDEDWVCCVTYAEDENQLFLARRIQAERAYVRELEPKADKYDRCAADVAAKIEKIRELEAKNARLEKELRLEKLRYAREEVVSSDYFTNANSDLAEFDQQIAQLEKELAG